MVRITGHILLWLGFSLIALGLFGIYLEDGFPGVGHVLSPFNIKQWIATLAVLAPGILLIAFARWRARRGNE